MSAIPSRRASRRAALPLLAFLLLLPLAAGGAERGLPLITVFPAEVHKAGPQTFDLTQDARGILYFGNLHGLLTYDGAWWRLLTLPDEQVALSLATNDQGTVALGLVNDLGYLARDAAGALQYNSLLPLLPANQRDFGDVRDVCRAAGGFAFLTEKSLIVWDGAKRATVAAEFPPDDAPRGCLSDKGQVLLRGPKGLQRFDPITNRITPGGLDSRILLAMHNAEGKIVVAVREQGLFIIDNDTATPFAPAAWQWLKSTLITGGVALRDGRLVITTRQHGVAILDANGAIEQIIDAAAGLPDAVINEPRVDREGSLWLAMEGPLVRIDLASPVTVFDARRGLRGGAGDVARHAGKLYAATSHGLYVVDKGVATRIPGMEEGAWRLLQVDDELLVGTVKGIYRVTPAGALELMIENDGSVYDLSRSPSDPSRVWLAQGDGVSSIRKQGTQWQFEGVLPNVAQDISSVVEKDGVLWAGTVFNGILRIENPRTPKQRVTQFGSGEMNVYRAAGRVLLVSAKGEIQHIGAGGKLVADPQFGHIKAPRGFFVVTEDARGSLWINSTPPRVFEKQANGAHVREGRPLVSVTAADIQNLRITGDGIVWFTSDKGLFRYDPSAEVARVAPQPAPLIRRVIAGENRVLFHGASSQGEPRRLAYNFGRIRVEFAPVSYRPGVSYQYRLDPIDADWSEWSEEPFIDYTTLGAGDYTFRLRARGPAMLAGQETHWMFSVAPPWYRTPWAYALWALLAIALVAAVIRLRTGSLQRQAEKLRHKVAEQTAELQETVKLLEAANTQLEALSLEDDLTGIANRRSFERALADEWNRARRHEQPLALILLDLDHFKDLNDRRGHPAGDDCLRRVGAFLAETIKRSGEVVARYGGEEFAILLPGVDADVAIRVAETLRDGIERLAVPYGNGTGRRMTASCGVAAITPAAQLTPESLVATADRALYAAKHSGRNCVRVADETTTGTWLRDVSA